MTRHLVTSPDEMEVNEDFRDTSSPKLCTTILDYINLGDNIFITHAGIRSSHSGIEDNLLKKM